MTSMYGHGLFPGVNSTSSPFAAVHSRSPFDDVPRARNPFENVSSPSPSVSYREDVGRFLGYHKPAHVPTNPFSTLDGCNPFASTGDSRFQGRSFVPEDAYQQQQARRLAVDSLGMTSMPSRNPWD
uniref:Ovule protein n=1 Tax=Steinernema glaseri TaxID=37863 RepID=A0A1I7ZDF5_9BILA